MLATREGETGLVDLLDRVLHKGLVLNADVIITVSGIPLIGLNLKAVLASVDTMIEHGIWVDWDKALRAVAMEEERRKERETTLFLRGETPLFRSSCSCWQNDGIVRSWRHATVYLTETRIVVNRKEPLEILWEAFLDQVTGCSIGETETVSGKEARYFHLLTHHGKALSLLLPDCPGFARALGEVMRREGLPWVDPEGLPGEDRKPASHETREPARPAEFSAGRR